MKRYSLIFFCAVSMFHATHGMQPAPSVRSSLSTVAGVMLGFVIQNIEKRMNLDKSPSHIRAAIRMLLYVAKQSILEHISNEHTPLSQRLTSSVINVGDSLLQERLTPYFTMHNRYANAVSTYVVLPALSVGVTSIAHKFVEYVRNCYAQLSQSSIAISSPQNTQRLTSYQPITQ